MFKKEEFMRQRNDKEKYYNSPEFILKNKTIYSLSRKEGYCFATNNYLANILNFHPKTISKWINNLEKKKILTIEYVKNIKMKLLKERYLYPIHLKINTTLHQIVESVPVLQWSIII